jgi:hypothetical protein
LKTTMDLLMLCPGALRGGPALNCPRPGTSGVWTAKPEEGFYRALSICYLVYP